MNIYPRFNCVKNINFSHMNEFVAIDSEIQKIIIYQQHNSSPASLIKDGHESDAEKVFNNLAVASPLISSIGVYRLESCTLMGQAFVFKDDRLLDAPDLLPDYVKHAVDAGKQWEINPQLPTRNINGCVVIAVSNAYQIYGHWIVDILPRLWLLSKISPANFDHPIVIPVDTPPYAIGLIKKLFGERNFVYHDIYKENLKISEGFLPSMLHNSHYFHFAINEFVSFVVDRFVGLDSEGFNYEIYKYIYVTRQNFRASSSSYSRNIINENEVIDLMKNLGFTIVSPEDFSWDEQVKIFNNAKIIVGEAGSAMHNTLFSKKKSTIICLNPTNHLQSSIAAVREQKIMSMCSQFELKEQNLRYTIDIKRLAAVVKLALLDN